MFIIIIIKSCDSESDEEKNTRLANCKKSIKCWSNEHKIDAEIRCKSAITRFAKYSVLWTEAPFVNSYSFKNKGVIRYIGDGVQFQNGFGTMTNICDYNTEQKKLN